MFASEAMAVQPIKILGPRSADNTAQATGNYVEVKDYIGVLVAIQFVGGIADNTSLVGALYTANASNGLGETLMTPMDGNWGAVTSNQNLQKRTYDLKQNKGWIKYVGTITGGPVSAMTLLGLARPQVSSNNVDF